MEFKLFFILDYWKVYPTLTMSDFSEIGSQDAVAGVLDGGNDLTLRQVKALSTRFNIDPTLFL